MKIQKEIPLLIMLLLPFLYLAYLWNDLPIQVPIHWNADLEVDRYGSKLTLLIVPFFLPVLTYLLFAFAPKLDPKNNLKSTEKKYQQHKFLFTSFMSVLAILIINSSYNQSMFNISQLMLFCGLLFLVAGNYFPTLKPNYFIGIRTPWTLKNEAVWKTTRRLGGKTWFIGGIVILLESVLFHQVALLLLTFSIVVLVPVVYSYLQYKKLVTGK